MNKMIFITVFLIFCSLFLFILGLRVLTLTLNKISSDKIKQLIIKFSNTDYKALLLGIIVTAICQSSNAITAITLSFITAKYLDFRRGLVIIIGANIGTTVTSIFFSFNIQSFGLVFLVIGIFLLIIVKNKNIGLLQVSLGLLLFGLNHLSINLECLLTLDKISPLVVKFNSSNIICFSVGTIISFIIQSSSASIGVIQDLHQVNLINLPCSICFVLGANIGTTLTGIIAGHFGSKTAKKAAYFNFAFNFFGSLIFLILIFPYTMLISFIQSTLNLSNAFTVSISHILYNIFTVFIFMFGLFVFDKMKKIK